MGAQAQEAAAQAGAEDRRGRFVGYTVGGKAYRILEDGTNKVFERRDVPMEETPAKADSSGDGSSAGPQLTMTEDSDNNGGMEESMDMLDAEGEAGRSIFLKRTPSATATAILTTLKTTTTTRNVRVRMTPCFRSVPLPRMFTMLLRGRVALHVGQPPR